MSAQLDIPIIDCPRSLSLSKREIAHRLLHEGPSSDLDPLPFRLACWATINRSPDDYLEVFVDVFELIGRQMKTGATSSALDIV